MNGGVGELGEGEVGRRVAAGARARDDVAARALLGAGGFWMPVMTRPILMSTTWPVIAPIPWMHAARSGRAGFAVVATVTVFASAAVTTWVFVPRAGGMEMAEPRAVVATGETLNAVLVSAQRYVNEREPEKAEAIMREAIAKFPEEREVRVQYAQVLLALGKNAEAYEQYVAALKRGDKDAATEFMAGTIASTLGKLDAAVSHYLNAQTIEPSSAKYPLYLAQVQIKLNKVDEAKANLLRSGRIDPDQAVVWGTLADLAMRENKPGVALQHIARARQIEAGVTDWRLIEARALKRSNRPEEAIKLLVGLDQGERYSPGVLQIMGECYGMLSRPADAAALYAAASEANPSNAGIALSAAEWYVRLGQPEPAKKFAQRASVLGEPNAKKMLEQMK
ncbi:MAG: tetratricopeptide repeat protein [Phycisphaerae bacterium]|nr:tetratricopeptide repeat protein [Phycisphaerae bacterium]